MKKMKFILDYDGGDGRGREDVTFECADPYIAVKAYAEAIVAGYGYTVKVYSSPMMEVAPKAATPPKVAVDSKLFAGYTDKELTCACGHSKCGKSKICITPIRDSFETPSSSWIAKVSWEGHNSSICVHKVDGTFIVYKSDYETFSDFYQCIANGESAGQFYNKNLKGKPIIKVR
jgi:hypothetical protein